MRASRVSRPFFSKFKWISMPTIYKIGYPNADKPLTQEVDCFQSGFDSEEFNFVAAPELDRLKEFWGWHQDFLGWAEAHPKNLKHGETVTISKHGTPGKVFGFSCDVGATGRFLYMWGNIGRVITADGRAIYCYFFCT
jgi:hypothetical protein